MLGFSPFHCSICTQPCDDNYSSYIDNAVYPIFATFTIFAFRAACHIFFSFSLGKIEILIQLFLVKNALKN